MRNLFYVVSEDTYEDGSFNGLQTTVVYDIVENFPKEFCSIEANTDSPYTFEEEIQEWLDNNGYEDEQFNFYRL